MRRIYNKIKLVIGTTNNENIWIVNTINRNNVHISVNDIKKYNLLTSKTQFIPESISCIQNDNGEVFRYVKWYGFKDMTKEPPHFTF